MGRGVSDDLERVEVVDVLRIASTSLQYVKTQITAKVNGASVNPTSDAVSIAFVATGTLPGVSDWKTADWETDATVTPNLYYARCLIGPGGSVTLTAGLYHLFVKITDSPEVPVILAGFVKVY
jgi:hypothetical protein